MRIGAVISNLDPDRVFKNIFTELSKYHEVEIFKFHSFKPPFFYYRIDPVLRRNDFVRFMNRNDVVYFEWASDLLAYASHLPKICPIVTRMHRYEMFEWVPKINWDAVDCVILLSEAMRRKFATRCPDNAHKAVVVPWAVSLEKFQLRQPVYSGNIGILCDLIPRKRIYELILTVYELISSGYDVRLRIGGGVDPANTDYYDAIVNLIQKLDIKEKISLNGKVTNVQEWLKDIDIFVSNSYSEGSQSALMEAMATGCYCISHHWDGAEEILPTENLFLTDKELYELIGGYVQLTDGEKQKNSVRMRGIACERFNNECSNAQIRNIIEKFSPKT